MFSQVVEVAAIILVLSLHVHSHALISPVLDVTGTPQRSDVQMPSNDSPCGNTNITANIDNSTSVVAAADGTFTVTVTSFNGGSDGSRQVTVTVDATGTGKGFVAGTVSKNGQPSPSSSGSEDITASLASGTTCNGGKSGRLCLASFKTSAGFGNCVVIQQGNGTTQASTTTPISSATSPTSTASNAASTDAVTSCSAANNAAAASMNTRSNRIAGTRAPRALRAVMEVWL